MNIFAYLVINTFAIAVAAYILPGIRVDGLFTAIVVAVVLGTINAFIKPILVFLTLPITIVTLGLFIFVINAALVMFAGYIIPGFQVDGFLWALLFSLVISLVSWFLSQLALSGQQPT